MLDGLENLLPEFGREKPPALTVGLILFWILLRLPPWGPSVADAMELKPDSLFHIDLNALTFYPAVHHYWITLVLDAVMFVPLIYLYERTNGTVRTGVVLNVTCFFPAIVFSIISKIVGFTQTASGALPWVLAFLAALSWKQYQSLPYLPLPTAAVKVPTWTLPLPALLLALVYPEASFFSCLLSLGAGYLLGMGHLSSVIEPPGNVAEWIEARIQPVIDGLSPLVIWYKEVEIKETRDNTGSDLPL